MDVCSPAVGRDCGGRHTCYRLLVRSHHCGGVQQLDCCGGEHRRRLRKRAGQRYLRVLPARGAPPRTARLHSHRCMPPTHPPTYLPAQPPIHPHTHPPTHITHPPTDSIETSFVNHISSEKGVGACTGTAVCPPFNEYHRILIDYSRAAANCIFSRLCLAYEATTVAKYGCGMRS